MLKIKALQLLGSVAAILQYFLIFGSVGALYYLAAKFWRDEC